MPNYSKPHLTFQQQVNHLTTLGLDCGNAANAEATLRDVGYYRLTAYTYPFRRLLAQHETRESAFQFRAPDYLPGSKLSWAADLHAFDEAVRRKVFDGLSKLELALRVQIAYVLGMRDKFGHVERAHLDAQACSQPAPAHARARCNDAFDYWCDEYDKLIKRARSEDYMQHFNTKYQGEVPIWIAVETLDFGALVRLFGLLVRSDQNQIARSFGLTDGRRLDGWLTSLAVVRNHCAHHMRVWNRQFAYALAAIPVAIVPAELAHIAASTQRKKLYVFVAVLAYALRQYDPTTNWHRSFATQAKKFPTETGLSLESDMGFPLAWENLPLWHDAPSGTRP